MSSRSTLCAHGCSENFEANQIRLSSARQQQEQLWLRVWSVALAGGKM
eukprot:SAG11_NODE_157_length_14147_cov_8.545202_14_plen_48_part_00